MNRSKILDIIKEEVQNSFNEKLNDKVFNINTVDVDVKKLQAGIKAPYVSVQYSTLGGDINVNIIITVSLDEKKDWYNGILHNSRYFMMHFSNNGTLELFSANTSRQLKFRKIKVKSVDDALDRINKYIKAVDSVTELISTRKLVKPIQEGVAETIAQQIGNKAFVMMGAKDLTKGKEKNNDEFLAFKIGRNAKSINVIKIIYNYGPDTYTIQFIRTRKGSDGILVSNITKEFDDIYFDQLHEIIEDNTGLKLSLESISEYGNNKDNIPTKQDAGVKNFEKNIKPNIDRKVEVIKKILEKMKPYTKEYKIIEDILHKAENELVMPTDKQMDLITKLYIKSTGI